ncbi:MAG: hypothetical protein JWN70_5827 [Planctomycetaceae bacterium]|nr:hypothetical protein [Planctomycetaceae bacterium]
MRWQQCLSVSIAVLFVVGCGGTESKRIGVSGNVTYNGEPIEDGEISFFPEPGTEAPPSSALIEDGKYSIAPRWELIPGTYQIRVLSYKVSLQDSKLPGGALDRPPSPGGIELKEQLLPAKFNTKSTIDKLTVKSGQGAVKKDYDLRD